MLHAKFLGNRPAGPEKKNYEGFLPYMVCDQDAVNKLSFLLPNGTPHKIWL